MTRSLPPTLRGTLSAETERSSAQAFSPSGPVRLVCVNARRKVSADSTYGRGASAFGAPAESGAGVAGSVLADASVEGVCARATLAASRMLNSSLLKTRINHL